MIVLDASVLIGHLDASDAHHEATLADVLVGPARAHRSHEAERARGARRAARAARPGRAMRLAKLRASTRLKLPDCCVLLAAHNTGGEVATFDDHLARAADALGLDRTSAR